MELPAMHTPPMPSPTSRLPLLAALITLGYLTFEILQPFLVPLAWAAILCFVSWPAYRRLLHWTGERPTLSASLMTLLLAIVLIGPLAWLLLVLQGELAFILGAASHWLQQPDVVLPAWMDERLPWLAREFRRAWLQWHVDPAQLKASLSNLLNASLPQISSLAGGIGRNIGKLACTLFAAFFLYRDGEAILRQLRRTLARMTQHASERYLRAAGDMTRAVVFGIVLTALAQGTLAGIGYAVANAPNPVFLMLVTFMLALVPFGTPFAWGGVALWLLVNGHTLEAIGMAIWGTFVVSTIDNIIRPLVISSATQISFLLVMFGVLGGLACFGMIGLFLGPVILAVASAIWQEWLQPPHS